MILSKSSKSKKKKLKTLNSTDLGYEKRIKTEGNVHLDSMFLTNKK